MKEIGRRAGVVIVELTENDLNMIVRGLVEADKALEDWEFQTRTGYTREEWRRFLEEVMAIATAEG